MHRIAGEARREHYFMTLPWEEMRKLLNRKIVEQNGVCPICKEEFTEYADVVTDHRNPKGMGGAFRDDHPSNI